MHPFISPSAGTAFFLCLGRAFLLAFVLLSLAPLPAQPLYGGDRDLLSLAYGQGLVLKHRPAAMPFDLPAPARSIALEWVRQTRGEQPWHRPFAYPRAGLSLGLLDYGNPQALGKCLSVSAFADFRLAGAKRWQIFFRPAYGLAWVSRPYEREQNPSNSAIGSHVNNSSSLSLQGELKLGGRWRLAGGAALAHQSNARLRLPNLGLNSLCWQAGLRWQVRGEAPFLPAAQSPASPPAWRAWLRLGWGMHEQQAPDGPFYSVYAGAAGITRISRPHRRWLAGLSVSYHSSLRHFRLNHDIDPAFPALRPFRSQLFAGHEFLLGRVGISTQAFANLPRRGAEAWGFRLGPQVYLWRHAGRECFAGLYLIAHKAVADYAELTLGFVL